MESKAIFLKNVKSEDITKILNTLNIIGFQFHIDFKIESIKRRKVKLSSIMDGLSKVNSNLIYSNKKAETVMSKIFVYGVIDECGLIYLEKEESGIWFLKVFKECSDMVEETEIFDCSGKDLSSVREFLKHYVI